MATDIQTAMTLQEWMDSLNSPFIGPITYSRQVTPVDTGTPIEKIPADQQLPLTAQQVAVAKANLAQGSADMRKYLLIGAVALALVFLIKKAK